MRRLLILTATTLLAGCTTLADQLHGTLTPPSGNGYAVFSMTVRTYAPEQARAGINWQSEDGSRHGTVRTDFGTDSLFGEEGSTPVDGKLQLLTLPPGHYRLQSGYASWNDHEEWWQTTRMARFTLDKPFDVRAGETVYLGEVRFNLDNLPDVEFADARQRDYGHIRRIWKITQPGQITATPFSGTAGRSN